MRAFVLFVAIAPPALMAADLPTCAGPAFGTTYRVMLGREMPDRLPATIHRDIEAVIARIDRAASTWRDDSDASRFNRAAPGEWVDVSRDLLAIVEVGRRINEASHGAFDMTVTGGAGPAPGLHMIETRRVPPALKKACADATLDLGGIGPGYAVDMIGTRLVELGSTDHLVELGGEVRVWGRRSDGAAWRVRIGGAGGAVIDLAAGMALATSTARPGLSPIDPRTGRVRAPRPPRHRLPRTS